MVCLRSQYKVGNSMLLILACKGVEKSLCLLTISHSENLVSWNVVEFVISICSISIVGMLFSLLNPINLGFVREFGVVYYK